MIDYIIAFLIITIGQLCYSVYKIHKHIDALYERFEYLEREIEFQDEWSELDFEVDDED